MWNDLLYWITLIHLISEPPILIILQTSFDIDIDIYWYWLCGLTPPPPLCETAGLETCTAFTQAVHSQSPLLGLAKRLRVSPCISPAHKASSRWGKLGVGIPKQCRTRPDCTYRIQSLECLIVVQTNLPCWPKLWAYPVTALVCCLLQLLKVRLSGIRFMMIFDPFFQCAKFRMCCLFFCFAM